MTTGRDDTILRLRVVPRASRDEIVGWREPGVLSVRVTAPPVEGEANRAVSVLLARALGVRPSAVTVVRGERGRDKLIRVEGLAATELQRRLGRKVAEETTR
jgi:uncharacterized protein (TIGR00251 family)